MLKKLFLLCFVCVSLASCSLTHKAMKEPANLIEFQAEDFEFSNQVSAEAETTYILGIDWKRLFTKRTGGTESPFKFTLPIIGDFQKGKTHSYALYNLLDKNKGYDIVVYPQYERSIKGLPLIFHKETVKVKARLGKIK